MTAIRTVLHVRTGSHRAALKLDAWLTTQGVNSAGVDDIFAACVELLNARAAPPDLVLVGADWLAVPDLAIVSYVRQTWPRTPLLLYGAVQHLLGMELLPLVAACPEAELLSLLDSGVPGLCARCVRPADANRGGRLRMNTGLAFPKAAAPVPAASRAVVLLPRPAARRGERQTAQLGAGGDAAGMSAGRARTLLR